MAYGKSYGAKNYVINQYRKKESQFLYLRRYENELKQIFEKDKNNQKDFFTDIRNEFSDISLEAKQRKFYYNDNIFGYAKRMTAAQDLKSGTYENIKTIVFDEYFIEKNKRYYLPNEGMLLLSIFDSVIRNRNDIKIFIIGNAVPRYRIQPTFFIF